MEPEVLNIAPGIVWLGVLSNMLAFGVALYALFSAPSKKNATRIDGIATQSLDLGMRVSALEQTQRSMPTKDDMHNVSMALEGMKGEMKAMRSEMKGDLTALGVEMRGNADIMLRIDATVSRHENHLSRT